MMLPLTALLVLMATTVLSALSRALLLVSPSQLERYLEEHERPAADRWILERLERAEWAVAFLRTFGRIAFFALVLVRTIGLEQPLTLEGMLVAAGVAAVLSWLFTGVVAGGVARYAPEALIARSILLLRCTYGVLYPLVRLADAAEGTVGRMAGAPPAAERQEEELLSSIEDTQRQGAIDEVSAAILENAVEFGDTTVGGVMTPRSAVRGLAYTDDLASIRDVVQRAGYSRFPVYRGSLDQVQGILYVKDLVPFLGVVPTDFRLEPLLRTPMRVPESKPVRELLLEFQRSHTQFAVVVDEYGGVSGVVTIEDVLEELVGEIRDEHERVASETPELRRVDERTVEVRGRLPIHELNTALEMEIPEDEGFETVAGLLLERLRRIPDAGTTLESDGARFDVLRVTPTTIELVRVTRLPDKLGAGD